jgi:fatty-acyl-CoA synthase
MKPTPTINALPFRGAEFASLAEALDYAARGATGFNFYAGAGKLAAVLPYAALRKEARQLARRLLTLTTARGARVAMVAETDPDFMRFFFACQYAGLVPVPLPAAIHIGGHKAYIENLQRLLETCQAEVAIAPDTYLPMLKEACRGRRMRFVGPPGAFDQVVCQNGPLPLPGPQDLAYLQYTSGSTRFPRGVMVTQAQVMNNLQAIVKHGLQVTRQDRAVSWLPFYHDMGLVGFVLAPLAAQTSVDYLSPRSFAMRPRQWLALISRNKASLSFSPPFGYELCAKSIKPDYIAQLDLSTWRVAGLGAEPIRPEPLERFAALMAPAGFNPQSFMAGYGMAECALAVSFSPLGWGLQLDCVDRERLAAFDEARPVDAKAGACGTATRLFVDCGEPLPGYEFEIRDEQGKVLPERAIGTLFVRGSSVMAGYFSDPAATRQTLTAEGWLNTGDRAYRIGRHLVIAGREKDMIIINGRNIWPQDLENLAASESEVRGGDASAFAIRDDIDGEQAVLVVQCRNAGQALEGGLVGRIRERVMREWGISCRVDLVPRNTLPRTTSGKLSRSRARREYIQRQNLILGNMVGQDLHEALSRERAAG